jgi:hypothetical protein
MVYYCNQKHQRSDWEKHQLFCDESTKEFMKLCKSCNRIIDTRTTSLYKKDKKEEKEEDLECYLCIIMKKKYEPNHTLNDELYQEVKTFTMAQEICIRQLTFILNTILIFDKKNECNSCNKIDANRILTCSDCWIFKNCSQKCKFYSPHDQLCKKISSFRDEHSSFLNDFENYYINANSISLNFILINYKQINYSKLCDFIKKMKNEKPDTEYHLHGELTNIIKSNNGKFNIIMFQDEQMNLRITSIFSY